MAHYKLISSQAPRSNHLSIFIELLNVPTGNVCKITIKVVIFSILFCSGIGNSPDGATSHVIPRWHHLHCVKITYNMICHNCQWQN